MTDKPAQVSIAEQITAVRCARAWIFEHIPALDAAVKTLEQVQSGELVLKGSDPLPDSIQWALNSGDGSYHP